MLTYQEFRDKYVREKDIAFTGWAVFEKFCKRNNWPTLVVTLEKVAVDYAKYCVHEAWEEACDAQKDSCEGAMLEGSEFSDELMVLVRNSPKPPNPHL